MEELLRCEARPSCWTPTRCSSARCACATTTSRRSTTSRWRSRSGGARTRPPAASPTRTSARALLLTVNGDSRGPAEHRLAPRRSARRPAASRPRSRVASRSSLSLTVDASVMSRRNRWDLPSGARHLLGHAGDLGVAGPYVGSSEALCSAYLGSRWRSRAFSAFRIDPIHRSLVLEDRPRSPRSAASRRGAASRSSCGRAPRAGSRTRAASSGASASNFAQVGTP